MEQILTFKDLEYAYQNGSKKINILNKVNYSFEKNKMYAIVGPSGAGKTTTLALAGALDKPQKGEILYNDQNISKIGFTNYRRKYIGIVFQSYNLLNYLNALQNVIMTMEISGVNTKNKKERAYVLLEKVGISREEANRNINKLSGGQQQRVAIARAIATDAMLILADEPTGNLDGATAKGIADLFCSLAHDDGKSVIVVTHSMDFSRRADVVLELKKGALKASV